MGTGGSRMSEVRAELDALECGPGTKGGTSSPVKSGAGQRSGA